MTPAIAPDILDLIVSVRRDLHRCPELSWREFRTSEKIAERLEGLGLPVRRAVAGTGLIADLPGPEGVPLVALRADIDALPIDEETGLEFASENPGAMHACGHDAHSSMVLGAGALLLREGNLPAPVRLLFQPAEELGSGAKAMIEAGALDGVGAIFGGHVDRLYSAGELVVTDGIVGASTDQFEIHVQGRGGHGARPHEALDAVVAGSMMVVAMQTIVSREIDPSHPVVVTVGSFHAGTASNIIAAEAKLEGTIRALAPEARDRTLAALGRIVDSVADLHGAKAEFKLVEGTPALINDGAMAALARQAAREVAGEKRVFPMPGVNMGAEDFSYYLQKVPGCYIRIGAKLASGESWPAHSSRFDVNEDALPVGAAWLARTARLAGEALAEKAAAG